MILAEIQRPNYITRNYYLPEGCSLDFSEFKFLKVLTISGLITTGSELGDEGASNLILPEGLEKLDLGNNIGDEGAKDLLTIGLKSCLLGTTILEMRFERLRFTYELEKLCLSYNNISDKGISEIVFPSDFKHYI